MCILLYVYIYIYMGLEVVLYIYILGGRDEFSPVGKLQVTTSKARDDSFLIN